MASSDASSSASASQFTSLFGTAPEVTARAPGRVNLIGEHTDYNGGFVLPTAIPQRTTARLRRREGQVVRAVSENMAGAPVSFELGREAKTGGWSDYVAGVTSVLRKAGHEVSGFDVELASTVPLGSGLSSSAALEVALLRALREVFSLSLDDVGLALLAQKVETDFVGAPIGVMDQMASSLADEGVALFLDTRSLRFQRVPLPSGGELGVIDSGVTHSHATGEYRVRRAQCEEAARLLSVPQLRDLSIGELDRIDALPDALRRRVRHVVTENDRVLRTVEALRAGRLSEVGRLFAASHASMRDDYEVSVPEIDLLVHLASHDEDVFGARLTGGGFGGSIVFLAKPGTASRVAQEVARGYQRALGREATVLVPP